MWLCLISHVLVALQSYVNKHLHDIIPTIAILLMYKLWEISAD